MSQYHGSPLGIKFLIAFYNIFGYKVVKAFIYLVALFYAIISQSKRKELESYYVAVGLTPSPTSIPVGLLVVSLVDVPAYSIT